MKRSIKKRVAGTFIGVMALTLVVIGVFHWAFMEKILPVQKDGCADRQLGQREFPERSHSGSGDRSFISSATPIILRTR